MKKEREIADQSQPAIGSQSNLDQTEEQKMLTEQAFLPDKRSPSPEQRLEEDSVIGEEDDEDGFRIEDFFQDEQQAEKLKASDGKFIISGSSKFIKQWSNMVILLAMYNSVTIPIAIFYGDKGPSIIQSEMIAFIDALVDLIFLIDIILTFRTTYLDTTLGREETDTHKIAKTYLKGSFTIDLASSVPFGAFVPDSLPEVKSILNLLGLLKLLRI